jgi:hypothetical protein
LLDRVSRVISSASVTLARSGVPSEPGPGADIVGQIDELERLQSPPRPPAKALQIVPLQSTFGIATLPWESGAHVMRLVLSWGSAVGRSNESEIYAAAVVLHV